MFNVTEVTLFLSVPFQTNFKNIPSYTPRTTLSIFSVNKVKLSLKHSTFD